MIKVDYLLFLNELMGRLIKWIKDWNEDMTTKSLDLFMLIAKFCILMKFHVFSGEKIFTLTPSRI